MKQIIIKNNELSVKIALLGAEIQEIKNLKDNFSYIWHADKKYWGRHAPILFPIVGRLNDNKYYLNGKEYQMTQHGFLRDHAFKVVKQKTDEITLAQSSTDQSLQVYPYHFTVQVTYKLVANTLKVEFAIENKNDAAMYYSIGLHPGLNITSDLSDYSLNFAPKVDELKTYLIGPNPFRSGKTAPTKLKDGSLALNYPMFDNGVKIFYIHDIKEVSLTSSKDNHQISEDISEIPYLSVWTPEKKHAPFICVEPYKGLPDKYGKSCELSERDGESHIIGHQIANIHLALKFA